MSTNALPAFLETVEPGSRSLVTELDRSLRAARPDLDSRVSYRMLMYGLGGDLRQWVVAIGATPKGVSVRFLHGAELRAAGGRLRPGSTTMGTIDFAPAAALSADDVALLRTLVEEATERLPEFRASSAAGGAGSRE